MQSDKDIPGISCGLVDNNIFEWEVMLMLSDEQDSLYGGEFVKREKGMLAACLHWRYEIVLRALAQAMLEARRSLPTDVHADVHLS
jgi:hypothetical protein